MQVYSNSVVCLWEKGLGDDFGSFERGGGETLEKNVLNLTIFIRNCNHIHVGGYVHQLKTDGTTVNTYHAKFVKTECGDISSRDQYQQLPRFDCLDSFNTSSGVKEATSVLVSNESGIIEIENSNQVVINLAKMSVLNVSGPGQIYVLNCGEIHTSVGNVNIGTGRVDFECESKSGSIEITQCGLVKTESGNITIGRQCKSAKSRRGRISIPRALKAAAYSMSGKVIYRDETFYGDV